VSLNVAGWKISALDVKITGKIIELNGGFSIATFDYRRVNVEIESWGYKKCVMIKVARW
jgi:hypothetical protein